MMTWTVRPGGNFVQTLTHCLHQCENARCENGATCVDKVDDYVCACLPGFTGKLCGEEINECLPNPCTNGATCTDRSNDYECQCTLGRYSNKEIQQNKAGEAYSCV